MINLRAAIPAWGYNHTCNYTYIYIHIYIYLHMYKFVKIGHIEQNVQQRHRLTKKNQVDASAP